MEQKWEQLEITIIIYFSFEIHFHYFYICSEFSSPTWKNQHRPKCQFAPKIPIWPKSLLYKPSEKWLSPPLPPPSPRGNANYEILLDISMYIFNCNKTVEAIQRFIQALLMSVRWNKKLNLLIEFWSSTFIKFYFKSCRNSLALILRSK